MAYIYKITNQINGKIYIGKTVKTIQERWKEHSKDCWKERCEKRPLYNAMIKYGIENFAIEEIEQCDISILNDREIYWINYYRSYVGFDNCNGYNATFGGDGKPRCDYNWVYQLWQEGKFIKDIANITKYGTDTISYILKNNGITQEEIVSRSRKNMKKSILMLDKDTEEILNNFSSSREAAKFLNKARGHTHIRAAAQGKRLTAYGYKWKFN